MPPRVLIKPRVSGQSAKANWGGPAPAQRRYGGPSKAVMLSHFEEGDGQLLYPDSTGPLPREDRDEAILLVSAAYLLSIEKGRELKLPCAHLARLVSERKEFADAVSSGDCRSMLKCALEELGRQRAAHREPPGAGGAKLWPGSAGASPEDKCARNPERKEVQVLPSVYVDGSLICGIEAPSSEKAETGPATKPEEHLAPPKFVVQFNGVEIPDSYEFVREERNALAAYVQRMEMLAQHHPHIFTPVETIELQHTKAMICMPISLDRYDAVPLFIQNGDKLPRLVFAYSSKSQDSWRRFAGCIRFDEGINYWKGGSEHLQNFDWRVQKAIDRVYGSHVKTILPSVRDLDSLSIHAPCMIITLERKFQDISAGWIRPFDIGAQANRPAKIVDFWWSGNADDGYGTHINLVASSGNERYLHVLAITGDGLVPKFIQPAGDFPLNALGAPYLSVPLKKEDEWILTPIVEYAGQQERAWNATGEFVNIEGTIILGGGRVRIKGIHQSPRSPYFELDNGMRDFYRLLRTGSFEAADEKLRKLSLSGGYLPLSAEPETRTEPSQAKSGWRYYHLFQAFTLYYQGMLDPSSGQGESLMADYLVSSRDIAVFRRYADYVRSSLLPGGVIPEHVKKQVADKLWNMSVQWARDMEARTVQI